MNIEIVSIDEFELSERSMTREEAIEVLKDIYNYTRFDTYTTNEARTMAIKALEQEPCDDCISRQAVLNKAFEVKTGRNTSAMAVYAEDIRKELPVLPKREENTVSEEVYTKECLERRKLEYVLYILKRKISELI